MHSPLPRWSFLAALLCLTCAACLQAQPNSPALAGDYVGTLSSIHLRLHIQQSKNGALTGTLDSIDQEAFGIPCAEVTINGAQFSFSIPAVHGTYKGEILAGGLTISGI